MAKLHILARRVGDVSDLVVTGRNAWALAELVRMGEAGCTPIENPGPRWSAYVFNLKREHGLDIETSHEAHQGMFAGTHARYFLRTPVEIVTRTEDDVAIADDNACRSNREDNRGCNGPTAT
jgi:hypothetical protein